MAATDPREIILRRRARFIASAVGLTLTAAPFAANAQENNNGTGTGASDTDEETPTKLVDTRIAYAKQTPSGNEQCRAAVDLPSTAVNDARVVLTKARVLFEKKEYDAALAVTEEAGGLALLPEVVEMFAQLHKALGHPAAQRSSLEARAVCTNEKMPPELMAELEALRERTVSLTITTSGEIVIDGFKIDRRAMFNPIYLEPGSYEIVVRGGGRNNETIRRRLAFTGGEVERLELDSGEPMPCLSVCLSPPPPERHRLRSYGINVSPTVMVMTSGVQGGGLTVGASIAPFFRYGNEDAEVRAGVIASPSGGRGFTMPVGGWANLRIFPTERRLVGIGLGVESGYLIAPRPTRDSIASEQTGIDGFQPKSSAYIQPHIPIAITIGRLEVENRIGLMWSAQEDMVRSRFGLSYISVSIGLTWIPAKERFEDDELAGASSKRNRF